MDHSTLRLFLEVARRLSFAEVAAQRGLNPSSVSRSIAGLEDGLGVRLFQRTTRRMTLTESGAIFYRRVGELLDEFDQACEEARALSASPAGTLRMTASVAFGERMIVPLLPRFRALYPDVRLDLKFTDANVDLIAEGIDLAVRLGSRMVTDAIVTRLISTRYRICASPAYLQQAGPIAAPADLAAHPCVTFSLPGFNTVWRFRDRSTGTEEAVPIGSDVALGSALSVRSSLLLGLGPGLIADWLVQEDLAAGRLVDLFPAQDATATDFETAAWILYPSRTYLPQKVRVMIDFLKDRLGENFQPA